MTPPSYIYHPDEIQGLNDNTLYRFAYLIEKLGINRSTLERERDNGRLICHGRTAVLGRWVKAWADTAPVDRGKFVKMRIDGRYRPPKRSNNPNVKQRVKQCTNSTQHNY